MVTNANKIGFKLVNITTEQFATFEVDLNCEPQIDLSTEIGTGIGDDEGILGIMAKFTFKANNQPFIVIEGACHFEIKQDMWIGMKKDNKIIFPKAFIQHLAVITVGTTRGILHAKTENTDFNRYHIPTVNVAELINEDSEFDIE